MTADVFCSTPVVATSFDAGCDPGLGADLLSDQELRTLERRYRSQGAAVVVHAFQSWQQRANGGLPDPTARGIVLGSATGAGPDIEVFLDNSIRVGDHLVNPALFPLTVHHAVAGIAAIVTDCRGPNVVVSAGLGSAWSALESACALLHDRSAELVLVGGFESQPLGQGARGTIAAVVALALTPAVLGRTYLAPLSELVNGTDRSWGADARSGKARVAALVEWAEVFAGCSSSWSAPQPASYVIGASGDLGRAIAAGLIRAGHATGLTYHSNEQSVRELEQQAKEAGTDCVVGRCDTRSGEAIKLTYLSFVDTIGPPATLVYCAGIRRDGPLLHMSDDDWADVIETNLHGAMQFVRLAGADMVRARAGRIILISSVSGQAGVPGQANYGASKAGLESMVRSSAREFGQFGVTINGVAPGLIESAMTDDLPAALKRGYLNRIALRRFAQPDDIAPVVTFLTSEGARYITGQTIVVDGGLTA